MTGPDDFAATEHDREFFHEAEQLRLDAETDARAQGYGDPAPDFDAGQWPDNYRRQR